MADVPPGEPRCPICAGQRLPEDTSVAEKKRNRVLLQGRIYAVIPPGYTYSPFAHYATASLYPYPRKSRVKYLKFRLQQETDRWGIKSNDRVQVEGCLHIVDGKELIFDISNIEIDPLP